MYIPYATEAVSQQTEYYASVVNQCLSLLVFQFPQEEVGNQICSHCELPALWVEYHG